MTTRMYCGGHGCLLPCPECARNLQRRMEREAEALIGRIHIFAIHQKVRVCAQTKNARPGIYDHSWLGHTGIVTDQPNRNKSSVFYNCYRVEFESGSGWMLGNQRIRSAEFFADELEACNDDAGDIDALSWLQSAELSRFYDSIGF